nr:RNA-directed DNA polymerase, eukaryota [Tanacetum cinerariifolium]
MVVLTNAHRRQLTIDRREKNLDDDLKPLSKVVFTVNADNVSDVEEVFDEHATFMTSTGLKRGNGSCYGTNSLWEKWKETKRDDDYDPYDDDLSDSHDMSDNLQAVCDEFDITGFFILFLLGFWCGPFFAIFVMVSKFRGGSQYSNASLLERLSCNIFITNFPKQLSAKELWSTWAQYETTLDVYIPKKFSKQGKPFAFARFNKVNDVDQLIKNIRSVWLGNFHLYANVASFNRDTKPSPSLNSTPNVPLNASKPSFANVVKDKGTRANHEVPVMVLEPFNLNYEGKVAVIRAKKVTGWVPDFVPDSFQSNDCGDIHMKKNDLEKNYVESAPTENEEEKVAQEIFPSPAPKHVTKEQSVVHEVEGSINNMGEAGDTEYEHNNVSSGGSKQDHFDSMAYPIYSPQELSLKRALWSYICGIISLCHGEVIVMRDLNEICYASNLQDSIIKIDLRLDKGNSLPDDLSNRAKAIRELKIINQQASMDAAQKAKVTWAFEGDENSKFFHGFVNKKRRHLSIKGILVEGEWIDNQPRVKAELFNHFANRFSALDWTRVHFDGQFPRCLDIDQYSDLERDVSNEEIKRAVWDCGFDKSRGPDGFTFEFFKKFRSIVGGDVIKAINEFFNSIIFPNGCNSSFIALIPKVYLLA